MPNTEYELPIRKAKRKEILNHYLEAIKNEIAGKFECVTKTFFVYKTIHNGEEITFVQAPLGGAGAVQIMEHLITIFRHHGKLH